MEYVEGETLSKLRLSQPAKVFEPHQISRWVGQMVDALSYAHESAKLVHRDLKPENILINRAGDVKIMDFGIARSMSDSLVRVTMQSTSLGTLAYMSPQQAAGHASRPTDDIYAMGSTLYELLTGKPPFFTGDIPTQLRSDVPAKIADRRRDFGVVGAGAVPIEWENAIAACLAKDPAARPQTAREFGAIIGLLGPNESFRSATPSTPASASRAPVSQPAPRPATSQRSAPVEIVTRKTSAIPESKQAPVALILALIVLLFVVGAGVAYFLLRPKDTNTQAGNTGVASPQPSPTVTKNVTPPTALQPSPTATPGSSPQGPLAVPAQFASIQAAIDSAKSSQSIEIAPGTYRESLKLKPGITLIGKGDVPPVITTNGAAGCALTVDNCSSGEIRNLVFEHDGGKAEKSSWPVVMIRESTVQMINCRVRNGMAAGVLIVGGGKSKLEQVVSERNASHGFLCESRAPAAFVSCVAENNGGSGFGAFNIGTSIQLVKCRALRNGIDGLSTEDAARAELGASSFEGNARCGIYVAGRGSAVTAPSETACIRNDNDGIRIEGGARIAIQSARIAQNRGNGIVLLDPGSDVTIENCRLEENSKHGILFVIEKSDGAQTSGIAFRGNTILSHSKSGIAISGNGLRPIVERNIIQKTGLQSIALENGASPVLNGNQTDQPAGGVSPGAPGSASPSAFGNVPATPPAQTSTFGIPVPPSIPQEQPQSTPNPGVSPQPTPAATQPAAPRMPSKNTGNIPTLNPEGP
jgi:serine/threonine protein kinase